MILFDLTFWLNQTQLLVVVQSFHQELHYYLNCEMELQNKEIERPGSNKNDTISEKVPSKIKTILWNIIIIFVCVDNFS